jgi:hypothetical protein
LIQPDGDDNGFSFAAQSSATIHPDANRPAQSPCRRCACATLLDG